MPDHNCKREKKARSSLIYYSIKIIIQKSYWARVNRSIQLIQKISFTASQK